jgi:hypothetical protein
MLAKAKPKSALERVREAVKNGLAGGMERGHVYFIGSENSPVKIGFTTNNPEARLSGLQTGSPIKLKVLGSVPSVGKGEKLLHAIFEKSRLHGEW